MAAVSVAARVRRLTGLAFVVLVACSDDPAGPGPDPDPDPDPDPLPKASAALVSAPARQPSAIRDESSVRTSGDRIFVSMPPGTSPGGTGVTIRVKGTGASATVPMIDGGFDPVAVEAVAGDSLAITVARPSGSEVGFARVPARSKPVVVRTAPRHRRVDVPLNQIIQIVFNEPMDPTTLAPAIRLRAAGVDLAGTVTAIVVGDDVLGAQFVPEEPLQAGTTYALEVSTAARKLDGTPLDSPALTEFTTGSDVTAPTGTVVVTTTTTGPDPDVNGYGLRIDDGVPQPIGASGTISIALAAGEPHSVELTGVAGNCTLAGTAYRIAQFAPGASTTIAFEVGCQTDVRPSGTIAYTTQSESTWSIFTSEADGSGPVLLASGAGQIGPLAWSPDGERFAFSIGAPAGTDIFVMNADGSNLVRRTDTGENYEPSWSPDGRRLVFASRRGDRDSASLYIANLDEDWADPTLVGPPTGDLADPAWSPDGTTIAFVSLLDDGWDSRFYMMGVDGSGAALVPVTSSLWGFFSPAWSPDGATIAVSASSGGPWDYGAPGLIVLMKPDGSEVTAVGPENVSGPAWSPDGTTIAYSAYEPGVGPFIGFVRTDGRGSSVRIDGAGSVVWRP
jgi:hypothetical protein